MRNVAPYEEGQDTVFMHAILNSRTTWEK